VIVTLPRGGGASDTGESPWRQLQERAQKIQGDKKHIEGMLSQSHCVAQFNTAHKPPSSGCFVFGKWKRSEVFAVVRNIKIHLIPPGMIHLPDLMDRVIMRKH